MSELSKLFPSGFIKLPSWLSHEQKQFILRAVNDHETLLSENERLTAIATKHATREDGLYEALDSLLEALGSEWTHSRKIHNKMDEAKDILDKSRIEAEVDDEFQN